MMKRTIGICTSIAVVTIGAAALMPSGPLPAAMDEQAPAHRSNDVVPSSVTSPPFDDIPGLGVLQESIERDDLIAYWEAWKRDSLTSECMAEAGFTWHVESLYPDETVVEISGWLDVAVPETPETPLRPEEANRRYAESLSPDELDRYYLTLGGEPAHVVLEAQRTETIPAESSTEPFMGEGCIGDAWAAVGSVWSLDASLAAELDAFRAAVQDGETFTLAVATYRDCLADRGAPGIDDPRELELAALSDPEILGAYADIDAACNDLWIEANRIAQAESEGDFRQRHGDLIDPHVARYEQVLPSVPTDRGFLLHLAEAAARAQSRGR